MAKFSVLSIAPAKDKKHSVIRFKSDNIFDFNRMKSVVLTVFDTTVEEASEAFPVGTNVGEGHLVTIQSDKEYEGSRTRRILVMKGEDLASAADKFGLKLYVAEAAQVKTEEPAVEGE